jgi:deoxycytidine triphosphate deaminase
MRKMHKIRAGGPGLLGRDAIAARVAAGEIFARETFAESNLRGAAYNLRVARDLLVAPDGRRFGPGNRCPDEIVLQPGDTAFVTTHEQLRLPWDIAANIAPKYDKARHGLAVFSGLLVDPGYGLERSGAGWTPRADERLHFLVTNLSDEERVISPGTQIIAALQFFEVSAVPEEHRREIAGGALAAWSEIGSAPRQPIGGLGVFKDVADVQDMRESISTIKREFDTLDKTTDRVVVFGLYVLAAALLGLAITALVAILGAHRVVRIDLMGAHEHGASNGWALILAVALGGALAAVILKCLGALAGCLLGRRRS